MNLSELYKKRLQELAGIDESIKTPEFIYHGTNNGAAYHIQKSGGMKINAANNNEPYISFTSDLRVARYYAEMKGGKYNGVIFRILRTPDFSLSPKFKKNKGYEWITKREIPLKELEIETKEGWIPLEKWDIIDKRVIKEEEERKLGKSLVGRTNSPFVVIYRAAPNNVFEFKDRDYVTLSKRFAIEHAENNHIYHEEPFHVIQALVQTKNVYDAYNLGEYFYSGENKKGKEIYISKGDEYEGLDEREKSLFESANIIEPQIDNFLSNFESAKKYAYENIEDVTKCFDAYKENSNNMHNEYCYDNYIDLIHEYVNKYNSVKNEPQIEIYRLVKLNSIGDLDLKEIGKHWSFEINGVGDYGGSHPNRTMTKTGKPFILTALVNPKYIDWEYGFHSFIWYGTDQWECALNNRAEVLITKINNEKLEKPFKATVGFYE